ncbi:P-loop containing nucleoside triphosphate hydrolase protein [Exidia glandulosa HHB12029]|uniref:p-loop containing nucleoside triphosphate hydrolase protein n=1 Tax=Exidia glandulosa HHB12029 TaxID=1314781 RepID=A0A165M0X7_EXIGL|nr:P-loop containing nucleoside triphosphate hydrolase protein [Exidia glandulosa HHB12029]
MPYVVRLSLTPGLIASRIWHAPIFLPLCAAAISSTILLLHLSVVAARRALTGEACVLPRGSVLETSSTERVGGGQIFTWKLAQFIGCLTLLGLSVFFPPMRDGTDHRENHQLLVQASVVGPYTYASALALLAILAPLRHAQLVSIHLEFVLFSSWALYVYCDIWPLATYTLAPLDPITPIFIIQFTVLTFVAVITPLLVPTPYVAVDPRNPAHEPAPEQTASLLSFMLYSFLDPLVWAGYHSVHLAFDRLPPLADYDTNAHLTARAFKHMDPSEHGKGARHVFWGLAAVFKREYSVLSVVISIRVITSIVAPIGLNRLLNYIETEGVDAKVKPWVWIAWLFWGPFVSGIAMQWYLSGAARVVVRVESIVTQLVFEHALKLRVKEEAHQDTTQDTLASTAATVGGEDNNVASPSDSGGPCADSDATTAGATPRPLSPASAATPSSITSRHEEKDGDNLLGKITNLVTSDVNNITDARDFLFLLIYCPLQLALCLTFLYLILGWSTFAGLVTMIATFPLPGWIASKVNTISQERMKKTDARIQYVTETMGVLRMIKLFAWESKINERLREKREDELVWIRKGRIMNLVNMNLKHLTPLLTMMVTYATYTLILGNALSASVVFSSMAVFEMLRDQLHIAFHVIPACVHAKVSLDRLTDFLNNTELLDRFTAKQDSQDVVHMDAGHAAIGFHETTFRWAGAPPKSLDATDRDIAPVPSSGQRTFKLQINGSLLFKRGALNLIVGPTGSGKTSLLLALLGELHLEPASPSSWYQLPRGGGVAYAAQELWIQNKTIKDNILFGAPYDEERYNSVAHQCALERDLSLFHAGDETEVGERGVTLSGGQKARIALARAIYSTAEIILLDDVLSALDVHTAKWVVERCFKSDLVRGRTVVLVTHNVALVADTAEYVAVLGLDGCVRARGSITEVLSKDETLLAAEVSDVPSESAHEAPLIDEAIPDHIHAEKEVRPHEDGKLIAAEEIDEGHVSKAALGLYMYSLGGVAFWIVFLLGMFTTDIMTVVQTYFLGYWASRYEVVPDPRDVSAPKYLLGYGALLLGGAIIYFVAQGTFVFGSLRASRSIHNVLMDAILGTTIRWLDVVPTSRVITRCTQDLQAVDGPVSTALSELIERGVSLVCKLGAIVILSPVFVIPGVFTLSLGWWLGQLYMASQLSVKREMSNARSPVLGHLSATITGLTSIRAFGAEIAFKTESMSRIDKYTRAACTFYNLNRWVGIRMNAVGGFFTSALAAYLVYGPHLLDAARTGFSLVMAVAFSSVTMWFVSVFNTFEIESNSLERINQYVSIEQEPQSTDDGRPPAYWPTSGSIRVEHLNAKYASDGQLVLEDVNFQLKSGERVGVVGRTGSGKSSLMLSFLRGLFTSGHIFYDDIATDTLNLDILRRNITIIPQEPELLSGTLRQNLDPFGEQDDATLNDALRAVGLFNMDAPSTGQIEQRQRITLDTAISSRGGNLSFGQRQVVAIARAIVRHSKVVILDEATAAIDYATDTAIQQSIRHELEGVTVICVAHRLRTVMDADKIMVLDAGRLVEFDTPIALLAKTDGLLRSLVEKSVDRDELVAMATRSVGR